MKSSRKGLVGGGGGRWTVPVSLPSRPRRPSGRRVLVPECPQSHKTAPESWSEGFFLCTSIVSEAAADTASLFLIVPVGEGGSLGWRKCGSNPSSPSLWVTVGSCLASLSCLAHCYL